GMHYPKEEIIKKVIETTKKARENMVDVKSCYKIFHVKDIRVAGESIEKVLKGTVKAMDASRKLLAPILLTSIFLIIMFFILI
ncbi:MAG: DUF2070 family protein, partial [Candidatus Odinarchaeia archaeon]